jgi:hypothetical protein
MDGSNLEPFFVWGEGVGGDNLLYSYASSTLL